MATGFSLCINQRVFQRLASAAKRLSMVGAAGAGAAFAVGLFCGLFAGVLLVSALMERAMRLALRSTLKTCALTILPTWTMSLGSLMYRSYNSLMWINPS